MRAIQRELSAGIADDKARVVKLVRRAERAATHYERRVTYECLGEMLSVGVMNVSDDWRMVAVVSAANEASNNVFVFWERPRKVTP